MLKNTKGITLIALVVTIVVLLILAGVSISLVLDNNGIIQKSKDARVANRAGAIKEEITLWKADKFASDNGAGSHESMDDFLTRLKKRGLISEEDIKTIKDTKKLQVGKETISFPSEAKTLVQSFKDKEIKVGDYLNYNDYVDESKSCITKTDENGWADQKYIATKNTYWRVLGLDGTGKKLMLISQNPIKKEIKTEDTAKDWEKTPALILKGAYSYINCKKILNDISGIYSSKLGTAESITAEEINRLIGVTVDYENNKVYANADQDTTIDYWEVLGKQYIYKSSDYTPESYINGKNAAKDEKTEPATAYYYSWENLTISNTLKKLLFEGTILHEKSYWLASTAVEANTDTARFGIGSIDDGGVCSGNYMFVTEGSWRAFAFMVRPVVYLDSETTIEDLHVIDEPEDNWITYLNASVIANGDSTNGKSGNYGY